MVGRKGVAMSKSDIRSEIGGEVAQLLFEGGDVDGLKVLLVDDLTTDGGSKLGFARGLRAPRVPSSACADDLLS